MSVIDEIVSANQSFAANFNLGALPLPPARRLAVVACMDARLTVEAVLGLKTGDAHIIRNAGGIVTDGSDGGVTAEQEHNGGRRWAPRTEPPFFASRLGDPGRTAPRYGQ